MAVTTRSLLRALMVGLILPCLPASAEGKPKYLFLCRSPSLAYAFWSDLHDVQSKGVTLTPRIMEETCSGMKAGEDPQCIRVVSDEFKPVASGWGGALALTDGKTKVWFHEPDGGGWVHPDYYVRYVNSK